MTHKTKEYKVYEWLGEECIKAIDEEIELGIIKDTNDCLTFVKGYCETSGCVPIEVVRYIRELRHNGKIA